MGRIGRAISHAVHDVGHAASSAAKAVSSTMTSVAEGVGKIASAGIGAAKNVFENVASGLGNAMNKILKTGIGLAGMPLGPLNFFQGMLGKGGLGGILGGAAGGPLGLLGGILGGGQGGPGALLGGILGGGRSGPLGILSGLLGGGSGPGGLLPGLPGGILGGPAGVLGGILGGLQPLPGGPMGPQGAQGILIGLLKNLDGAFKALQDPGFNPAGPLQGLATNLQKVLGELPNPMGIPRELLQMQTTMSDVMINLARLNQSIMTNLRG